MLRSENVSDDGVVENARDSLARVGRVGRVRIFFFRARAFLPDIALEEWMVSCPRPARRCAASRLPRSAKKGKLGTKVTMEIYPKRRRDERPAAERHCHEHRAVQLRRSSFDRFRSHPHDFRFGHGARPHRDDGRRGCGDVHRASRADATFDSQLNRGDAEGAADLREDARMNEGPATHKRCLHRVSRALTSASTSIAYPPQSLTHPSPPPRTNRASPPAWSPPRR